MSNELRLIIVSGLSGSGKTIALHVLEDLGYTSIDNLPAALLKPAVNEIRSRGEDSARLLAVGIDARARSQDLRSLPDILMELSEDNVQVEIVFLHASDEILLQRYSESRRRHPLAEFGTQLRSAINTEREMLAEIPVPAVRVAVTGAIC